MKPNWPSLWEREPALRPDVVDKYGTDAIACSNPKCYAALCRDAAVRWLLSLGDEWWYLKLAFDPTNKLFEVTRYVEMAGGESDIPHQSFDSPSLDAAIFASCAAALDARDAKPNP